MKAVIYLRKSRADAEAESRGEGETLARHERLLLEVAKKQKLNIEKIYKEIVSGETIASRPVVQQLISEVEQGVWDAVLVVEIERLARGDTIDQGIMAQAFKYSNTKIITPYKTYDPSNQFDEEFFEFGLFMSRREYKTINRRLQQGRISSVKEGKYVGNKPPYGYIRVPLEKDKGFTLEPHPEQAPIVKMIFDLYVYGEHGRRLGCSLIVRKLNNLNIPAQKGVWVNSSVQTILRNPIYAGKIKWNSRPAIKKVIDGNVRIMRPRNNRENWIVVDGLHQAIVDEETFVLANKYIDSNPARPNPSQMATKNPLSGLVECAICGRNMVRRPYNKRGQADSLLCPYTHCKNISSPLYVVEKTILTMLESLGDNYESSIKNKSVESSINTDILFKSIENISKEILTLKSQLDRTYDLLEQGVYTTEVFLERTKSINEKIESLKSQNLLLEKELENIKNIQSAREKIIPQIHNILKSYYSLESPEEKNELLKQVLEKVTYLKTTKSTKKNISNDVTITLYPKVY